MQWFYERYIVQKSLLQPGGLWQALGELYRESVSLQHRHGSGWQGHAQKKVPGRNSRKKSNPISPATAVPKVVQTTPAVRLTLG